MALIWSRYSCAVVIGILLSSCIQNNIEMDENELEQSPIQFPVKYDLEHPKKHFKLPKKLKETSAIALWNDHTVLAVEDETATLYALNTETGKIVNTVSFGEAGDYEGLCLVQDDIWIAQSDGQLFRIKNWSSWDKQKIIVKQFSTPLNQANNVEGVVYDPATNSLLLACKNAPKIGGGEASTQKAIYRFSLSSKILDPQAAYIIFIDQLFAFADHLPKIKQFAPSDIAIHPDSKQIYIPSTQADMILVLNYDGSFHTVYALPKTIFEQVEALCFTKTGDLWCASEGKKKKARLWLFNSL